MLDRMTIPRVVIVFFAIDILLCLSYGMNFLAGEPSVQVTRLLNLDGEMNIPTWYSSMQWFCVAFLFGIFAMYNINWSNGKTWVLLLFPLMFLAFSIDEVACVHEWLGKKSDILLPTGHRKDTFFRITGIWFIVVGLPVFACCLIVLSSLRKFFGRSPNVSRKMMIGVFIFFGGAIGVEALSNIPDPHTFGSVVENIFEEGMEMAGVTVLLWAARDLLMEHGFAWRLEPAGGIRTSPAPYFPGRFENDLSRGGMAMQGNQTDSGSAFNGDQAKVRTGSGSE